MITDHNAALEAARKAITNEANRRTIEPQRYTKAELDQWATTFAQRAFEAIGFDELVASRERAIATACGLEEEMAKLPSMADLRQAITGFYNAVLDWTGVEKDPPAAVLDASYVVQRLTDPDRSAG